MADATQALTNVAFQEQSALDGAKNPKSDATSVIGKTGTERSNRAARVEVVFIDAALPDYQTLIDGVGPDAEIHLIDGDADGFEQVSSVLRGRAGIDAIHILGHGAAGQATLGTARLSTDTFTKYSETLSAIGGALASTGDVLLYGCYIAVGQDGTALIEAIANLTQADIAASNDLTGSAAQGGDWELEHYTGVVETESLLNGATASTYDSVLKLTGVSGGSSDANTAPAIISAPNNVGKNNNNVTGQRGFDERQNVTLSSSLATDGLSGLASSISSGTLVDSHMIYLNPASGQGTVVHDGVTWTFEGAIIGVMSDKQGNREAASNAQLGKSGTSYPGAYGKRGIESADSYSFPTANQITVNTRTKNPGDYLRVVTVGNTNDAPVAGDDLGSVNEGATLSQNAGAGVGANDTDVDGDTLTVTAVRTGTEGGSGTGGSVGSALTGTYGRLTLAAGATATDVFTYTVSDGTMTDTAQITVTVTGVDDAPVAGDDLCSVNEGATLSQNAGAGVGANDTDVDGDTLTVTAVRTGTEGGSGTGGSVGSALTGTYGRLTLAADGSYSYVADQNGANVLAAGATATDVFTYTVSDGPTTDTAQITVTVTGVNDAPTGTNRTIAIAQDGSHPFEASDFGFNDIDGGSLAHITIVNGPGAGTLKLGNSNVSNGQTIAADAIGDLVFTPAADANGKNYASFTFKVHDGTVDSVSANTITVNVTSVNNAPTNIFTLPDTTLVGGQGFLLKAKKAFTDVDRRKFGTLTYSTKNLPEGLRINATTGKIKGKARIPGTHNIIVIGTDGGGLSARATFTLTVVSNKLLDLDVNLTRVKPPITEPVSSIDVAPIGLGDIFSNVPNDFSFYGRDITGSGLPKYICRAEARVGAGRLPGATGGETQVDVNRGPMASDGAGLNILDVKVGGDTVDVRIRDDKVGGAEEYTAELADGSSLPEWIKVDRQTGFATAKLPEGVREVELRILARDEDGSIRKIDVILDTRQLKSGADEAPVDEQPQVAVERSENASRKARTDVDINVTSDGEVVVARKDIQVGGSDVVATRSRTVVRVGSDGKVNFDRGSAGGDSGGLNILDVDIRGDVIVVQIGDDRIGGAENYTGTLEDGSPLPEWIKVDPKTGALTVEPPDGTEEVDLRLIARDADGTVRTLDVVLDVGELRKDGGEAPAEDEPQAVIERFIPLSEQITREAERREGYGNRLARALVEAA